MKKAKRLTTILMISILIFMQMPLLSGSHVNAVSTDKDGIYSLGKKYYFVYDGLGKQVDVVFYKNETMPAYSLVKHEDGINTNQTYDVTMKGLLSNNDVWRAISNGYPYVSAGELGCNNAEEAYVATQMAIYYTYYNYSMRLFNKYDETDSSNRIYEAFKTICANADTAGSKAIGSLKIVEDNQNWEIDSVNPKYASKTYSIETEADYVSCRIDISGTGILSFYTARENNKTGNRFAKGEKFKVVVPLVELEQDGQYTLTATAELQTKPVQYGKITTDTGCEDYAIVTDKRFENGTDTLTQNFYANKAEIVITNQDGKEKTPLANAKFSLLDESGNVVYNELKTDDNGAFTLERVIPGTYYLEETLIPEGYYGPKEKLEINVGLNERITVTVNNFKLPNREYTQKPQDGKDLETGVEQDIQILPETGF